MIEQVRRFAPGLSLLRDDDRSLIRGDVVGGVSVAAYLIPQVLAYAVIAGLSPVTGLWSAMVAMVVYAVFGSSREVSAGPEASAALMTGTAITTLTAAAGGASRADMAGALAIAVGLLCLAGRIAHLGFLANLFSRPVLVGYMSGIAVLMAVSQLHQVLGYQVPAQPPPLEVWSYLRRLGQTHLPTLALTVTVFVLLLILSRVAPAWPWPLITIALATLAVRIFGWDHHGIPVVGRVPAGLPSLHLPGVHPSRVLVLLAPALGLALVSYADTILTGRAFAARRDEDVDAEQELVALGAVNIAAGLVHGFPVSSSGSRSALATMAGARTQVYSLVAVATILLVTLVGGPLLAAFPSAALAGVILYAATRMIDVAEWRRIAAFRGSELALGLATTIGVLTFNLIVGIGIAVGLSVLDLVRRIADPHDGVLGYAPGMAGMHDVGDYPGSRQIPGLVVYRYDSPLFFANADNLVHRALRAVDEAPAPVEWFVLNAEANVEVDLTSVDALEELRRKLSQRGIIFAMARVKFEVAEQLRASGLLARVGTDRIFPTLPTAVDGFVAWYTAEHGHPPTDLPAPPPDVTGR